MLTKVRVPLFLALIISAGAFAIRPTGHRTYFGNTGHYYPQPQPHYPNYSGYPENHYQPYYYPRPTQYWYDPHYGRYINAYDPGYWRYYGTYNGFPLNRYPYNRFIEPYNPYRRHPVPGNPYRY